MIMDVIEFCFNIASATISSVVKFIFICLSSVFSVLGDIVHQAIDKLIFLPIRFIKDGYFALYIAAF